MILFQQKPIQTHILTHPFLHLPSTLYAPFMNLELVAGKHDSALIKSLGRKQKQLNDLAPG